MIGYWRDRRKRGGVLVIARVVLAVVVFVAGVAGLVRFWPCCNRVPDLDLGGLPACVGADANKGPSWEREAEAGDRELPESPARRGTKSGNPSPTDLFCAGLAVQHVR